MPYLDNMVFVCFVDLIKLDRNHYANSLDVFRFPNTVTCDKYMVFIVTSTTIHMYANNAQHALIHMYANNEFSESQLLHQMKNCTPNPHSLRNSRICWCNPCQEILIKVQSSDVFAEVKSRYDHFCEATRNGDLGGTLA